MASSLGRILVLPGFFKFPHPEALLQLAYTMKMKHTYVQNSIKIAMFEAGHIEYPRLNFQMYSYIFGVFV